jgi:hypothetical protein
MREQLRIAGPGVRVGVPIGEGRAEQVQCGGCPLVLLLAVDLLAGDGLDEAVHAQRLAVLADRNQRVAPQRADGLLVGKRGSHGRGEPLGQRIGAAGRQAAGDVVGGQECAQHQQFLGCRRLLAEALD